MFLINTHVANEILNTMFAYSNYLYFIKCRNWLRNFFFLCFTDRIFNYRWDTASIRTQKIQLASMRNNDCQQISTVTGRISTTKIDQFKCFLYIFSALLNLMRERQLLIQSLLKISDIQVQNVYSQNVDHVFCFEMRFSLEPLCHRKRHD